MNYDIDEIIKKSREVSYNFKDDILKNIDFEFSKYYMEQPSYYKLLTACSMLYPDAQFIDIGTSTGASALAYLYGGTKKKVYTYDMGDNNQFIPNYLLDRIDLVKCDVRTHKFNLPKIDIMFLDISHNGDDEALLLKSLTEQGYMEECMVIFDDIHLNPHMERLWAGVSADIKVDITADGHGSGTGVIICRK